MGYFFTMAGIVIAVTVFVYFINAVDEGKRKLGEITEPTEIASRGSHKVPGENVPGASVTVKRSTALDSLSSEQKDMIPQRQCPLCRTVLNRDQPLYAGNVERDGKRTILIYGCQFCYKEKKEERENRENV
ncbi:MAG: hypothetical protein JXK07_00675 [Spirochaetes bacterium]|nr:hypothetical protein [Spirochaetota bacterium]MBN2770705.1 hypothetical protein [Spirochaetota bacterium]